MGHYPPQNVRGRKKVMVCKTCNNTAGFSYESSFRDIVLREAYNRKVGKTRLAAKSTLDDVRGLIPGEVHIKEDGSTFFKRSPKHLHRIKLLAPEQEASNNDGKSFTIQIKIKPVDATKAMKAILKTAYLHCFD